MAEKLRTYRDLRVWQLAMDFVEAVYQVTRRMPDTERFGLTSQVQRAAVSVPSNIAEGYARSHRGDYLHHLSIARGSLAEVETQLILIVRLGYITRIDAEPVWKLAQQIGRMLNRLLVTLRASRRSPEPRTLNPEPQR